MIWATVSSWCCFCWLYRASPSLAAKNIINLILILTMWWHPCVESSLVLLEEGVCLTSAFSWQNSVSLDLLRFVLQDQTGLLLQVFLDSLLLHSSPLWWKGYLLGVLILEVLIGLHRTIQPQLLQHYWSGYRLGLLWYWMVCLGNKQRSFCHFWDHIQVLHLRLFCWLWHFF